MLFKAKVLYRGQEQIWEYGTNSNSVTDCWGIRRNPKGSENVVGPQEDIFSISVFLGYNCNLNCTYCYQKEYHNDRNKVIGGIHMVPQFFERFKAMKLEKVNHITFWGGEPLVFWKTILEMVPRFEEIYPDVRFSMITNGTLLTEDKIDFMKAHRFSLNVSCDGFPDERGYDLLLLKGPELKYLMEQLGDRVTFQATVGKGREDVTPALNRFRKMLGDKVRVSFGHPVRATSAKDPANEQCLTEWKPYAESIYKNWLEHPENVVIPKVDDLKRRHLYRIQQDPSTGMCGASQGTSLSLGLDGNTYSCHAGSGTPTGTLEDYQNRSFKEFLHPDFINWHCKACPVRVACHSGCPITDKDGFKASCTGWYGLAMGKYKAVWKELFDVELVEFFEEKKESK